MYRLALIVPNVFFVQLPAHRTPLFGLATVYTPLALAGCKSNPANDGANSTDGNVTLQLEL
jgi:hypothetical protein